jgi:integrase/recombinase XerD
MNELATVPHNALQLLTPWEGDKFRLGDAYLARMSSKAGKAGMASNLRKLAAIWLDLSAIGDIRQMSAVGDKAELWAFVPWHCLNAAAVQAILAKVEGAPATKSTALSALKGIAAAGYDLEVLSAETLTRIRRVKPPRGKRLPTGRVIPPSEIAAVFAAVDVEFGLRALRDAAMIAFAFATGARRAEITGLTFNRIRDDGQTVSGTLTGKGDKERSFWVVGRARERIHAWIRERGTGPGFVFCRIERWLPAWDQPLSTTSAHRSLNRWAKKAQVSLTWHDFRRTMVSDMMAAGIDITTIAQAVGHANVTTTQRYDRRGDERILAALKRVRG